MNRGLQALNDHLRDENADRVAHLRGEEPTASPMPPTPVAPTPEDLIADFEARRSRLPDWYYHVPGGRFCVRYRYPSDRMIQVHRSRTAEDRARWMRDFLPPTCHDVGTWEDTRP